MLAEQDPGEHGGDDRLQEGHDAGDLGREPAHRDHTGQVGEDGRDQHHPGEQHRRGHHRAAHGGVAAQHLPVHFPGPGDHGHHQGADEHAVRDHAERVGGVVPVGALVGEDEVEGLAAGGGEAEEHAEQVQAQPGPDLDHASQSDDGHGRARGGPARHGLALYEADVAEQQRRAQVLQQQGHADGNAGQGGEVEGLHTCDGDQPEAREQRGPAQHEVTVAPGQRGEYERCPGHPEPDHVEGIQTRLDQRLRRHSGTTERERRDEGEAQSGISP